MKVGDTVYRKAPFKIVGIGAEKQGDEVVRTHLSLQAVETAQFINCLDTDVEAVPEAKPLADSVDNATA